MKKYVSQCIQEYLGPAYTSSNYSPHKKLKPVVMTIPGTAYLSKNIRDLHQYPDATLDNCSRTTIVFPQGDLNADSILSPLLLLVSSHSTIPWTDNTTTHPAFLCSSEQHKSFSPSGPAMPAAHPASKSPGDEWRLAGVHIGTGTV